MLREALLLARQRRHFARVQRSGWRDGGADGCLSTARVWDLQIGDRGE